MAWGDEIVAFVRRRGRATVSEVAAALDRSHARALRECMGLVDSGDLVDLGGALAARPDGRVAGEQAPDGQARLWKAARILGLHGQFTMRELALVGGCQPDYTSKYLCWLGKQGHVIGEARPGLPTMWHVAPDAPPANQAPVWTNQANRALRARRKQNT